MPPGTCSQVSLIEKLLPRSSARVEAALINKLGTEGRSQQAISVFNACSVMTTCHCNVVLDARRLAKSALPCCVRRCATFPVVCCFHCNSVSDQSCLKSWVNLRCILRLLGSVFHMCSVWLLGNINSSAVRLRCTSPGCPRLTCSHRVLR